MSQVRRPDLYAQYSIDPEYQKPEERAAAYNGLQEALKIAREEGDQTREADLLYLSARLCVDSKEFKKASTLFKKALDIYQKGADKKAIADTLEWLGHLSWPYKNPTWPHSRWNEAPQYYKKALTYYPEGDPACIEILLNLIKALIHRDNVGTTVTVLRQAAAWCERYQYPDGNGEIYAALAEIYYQWDDTFNMWEFYDKAVKAFRAAGNRNRLIDTLAGAMEDFSEMEIHRNALYFANELLEEEKKDGDPFRIACAYANQACIYNDMEDYPAVIGRYRKAIKSAEQAPDQGMLVLYYHSLGRALYYNGDWKESLPWYEKALKKAREENNPSLLERIREDMETIKKQIAARDQPK